MSEGIRIRDAQARVDAWIRANGGYWPPLSLLARLTEETGELAREYNHQFGAKKKKASEAEGSIPDELADILFITICLANERGIDLEAAFDAALEKLRIRDAGRWVPSP